MTNHVQDEESSARDKLLLALYNTIFDEKIICLELYYWCGQNNLSREEIHEICCELVNEGIARWTPQFGEILTNLTSQGIIYVEESGLLPTERVSEISERRDSILDIIREFDDKREADIRRGRFTGQERIHWYELVKLFGLSDSVLKATLNLLSQLGWAVRVGQLHYTLTPLGRELVSSRRAREERVAAFNELKGSCSTPQVRGTNLEVLIENIIGEEDWTVARNVLAPGEQLDLVINRYLEYYIIECKWEADLTMPKDLSILRDRVTSRPGMRGIFVSMAGYTPEAIKDSIDRLEHAMVLLFGPQDVQNLVEKNTSFSEMLSKKCYLAMVRRVIDVDGKEHVR